MREESLNYHTCPCGGSVSYATTEIEIWLLVFHPGYTLESPIYLA